MADSLSSGAIRFTGLGSGTDFESMITQLVDAEKVKSKQLLNWRNQWETKSTEFDKLTAAMRALDSTLKSMNTTDEFLIKSVTSSNSTALTATAGSSTEEGSHEVDIIALATTDMHMGAEIFSSKDDVISGGVPGTYVFAYAGRQIAVDISATTTLSQFADLINKDPDNRNYVRASVINDGSGYRLQIRGMDLGAGNDFIVDDAATNPELVARFGSASFIQTQNASNAKLSVDGFPVSPTPTAHILKAVTAYADPTDTLTDAPGTFKFAYDGRIYSTPISAGATVDDLVTAINDLGSGVTASAVINDDGKVELMLEGDPGSSKRINIINSPGTTLTSFQAAKFSQVQGATDGYIERSTNTISDVVGGVTMNLLKAGESTTLSMSMDTSAITEKARLFVDEVNTVLTVIRDQTKVDSVGSKITGSILTGNYGLQMIQQNLKKILAQRGVGFDYDTDPLLSLASVGITTDSAQGSPSFGLLVFDEKSFKAALNTDPDAVARLFSADFYPSTKEIIDGEAMESPNFKFDSFVRGVTQAGNFEISYTISGGVIAPSPPPTINGYPASIDGNKIVAIGGENAARGLAIEVINTIDGTYSGQAQLKSGKTEELSQEIKKLTDSQSGTLEILKNNYQDIMDSIDEKLAYEERRLALLERTMRMRFANLEAVLGTYDNISNQLKSQIAGLPKSSS
ncbi:MAG: flagellar filament capping protein FliD [Desulfovibrionales bacterium]|nr:flagellar filament capping protein FliD [Desulfovibrionales bacterium]